MTVEPDQLLRQGIEAYEARQWSASEAAFHQLMQFSLYEAEASYGIGMARMGVADWTTAERYLHHALTRDPRHADAAYQLGRINEGLRSAAAARPFYERALAINPGHAPARERLGQNGGSAERPQPAPVPTAPQGTSGGFQQYSVLDFLLQDRSPLSMQAAELIRALQTERHAYFSVYLGPVVFVTALFVGITAVLGALRPLLLLAWLAWLAVAALAYVRVKATRYVLANGRLQVTKGLLSRRIDTYDLWLVHDITMRRTLVNRLTGDGSLVLHYSNPVSRRRRSQNRVIIKGLARGRELTAIYQRLQNLKFVLRANPAVKGIIQ